MGSQPERKPCTKKMDSTMKVKMESASITETELNMAGRPCEEAKEEDVRRREVLELVDEEHAAHTSGRRPRGRVGAQDLDGAEDLFVEVDRAGVGQAVSVLGEDVGEAGDVGGELLLDGRR